MGDTEHEANEYIVEYIDGPLAGRSERRLLIHGTYDHTLSAVAAVEGMESLFRYTATDSRAIQGEVHVRYSFDATDSDPVEPDVDED